MLEFLDWWAASNWRIAFAFIILIGTWTLIDTIVVNICHTWERVTAIRKK